MLPRRIQSSPGLYMLMLCEPVETGMDAVKLVEVSLPKEGKRDVGLQIAIEKNFKTRAGSGNLKHLHGESSGLGIIHFKGITVGRHGAMILALQDNWAPIRFRPGAVSPTANVSCVAVRPTATGRKYQRAVRAACHSAGADLVKTFWSPTRTTSQNRSWRGNRRNHSPHPCCPTTKAPRCRIVHS